MNCDEMSNHYLELAERMFFEVSEGRGMAMVTRLRDELPQIRLIFDWFQSQKNVHCGLRLAYLMQVVWQYPDHTTEGVELLKTLLTMSDSDDNSQLKVACEQLLRDLEALELGRF